MEIRQLFSIVWRRLWLIVLATLAVSGTAYAFSVSATPVYEASATIEINYGTDPRSDAYSSMLSSERAARTYVEEFRSVRVADEVARQLGLNMSGRRLLAMTRADQVRDTQLLRVTAESSNAEFAKVVANKMAEVFIAQAISRQQGGYQSAKKEITDQITALEKQMADTQKSIAAVSGDSRGSSAMPEFARVELVGLQTALSSLQTRYTILLKSAEDLRLAAARYADNLTIFAPAEAPTSPVRPQITLNIVLGILGGLILGFCSAFLLEHLDDTIKQPEDVNRSLGASTLGMIARMRELRKPKAALVALNQGRSSISEAYRVVRANFQFATVGNEHTSVVITSALPKEGKSTTIANLAIVLAQTGKKVIVVDSDLRRPTLHKLFGISAQPGVSGLIVNPSLTLDDAMVPGGVDGLWVLPSGPLPPNPAELLVTDRMARIIEEMQRRADYVLFDTPPVLSVADASLLAAITRNVIIVVGASETRTDSVVHAKEALLRSNARLLGVILNKLSVGRGGYNYYYYHHYYGSDGSNGKDGAHKVKKPLALN